MMKNILLFSLLAVSLSVPLRAATNIIKNNERIHYKCYVSLSDASEVIHGFVTSGKTQSEFEQELLGRMVYSTDGVTGFTVEVLHQCVKAKQKFTSRKARELEAITPF